MAVRKRKKPAQRVPTATLVTNGTTLRIETPKSGRQPKQSVAVTVAQEINPASGFTEFLRENAIVALSIGFIVGSQMAALIKIIVANFIDPLSHLLFGTALSKRTFMLSFHGRVAYFGWGGVVYALFNIILLLFLVFLAFKFLGLHKFDKPKEPSK